MTAQIADTILHDGSEFRIAAIENAWPFTPQAHGFEPTMMHPGCYRGYYCQYVVVDRELLLSRLNVAIGTGKPVTWRGIAPKKDAHFEFDRSWTYEHVNLRIEYSGGLVSGDEFLREYYVHMGFQRPHCYRRVLELRFEKGRLQAVLDHSDAMERERARLREFRAATGRSPTREEIAQFVDDAFSLAYEKKWST